MQIEERALRSQQLLAVQLTSLWPSFVWVKTHRQVELQDQAIERDIFIWAHLAFHSATSSNQILASFQNKQAQTNVYRCGGAN